MRPQEIGNERRREYRDAAQCGSFRLMRTSETGLGRQVQQVRQVNDDGNRDDGQKTCDQKREEALIDVVVDKRIDVSFG